jgi:parvulin-like peptidyl-prolyl isomerase
MAPRALGRFALLAVALAACGALRSPAARVDGTTITDAQVAADAELFTALSDLAGQQCYPPLPGESEIAACGRAALANLIRDEILSAYARDNGIAATPQDIDEITGQLVDRFGGIEPLEGAGVTEEQLRAIASRVALSRAVQDEVGGRAVSPDDVRAAYDRDLLSYTLLHTQHILLPTRELADEVYALASGPGLSERAFLKLAGRYSTDPSVEQNGGDLGSIGADGLDPAYANAAIALEPGGISPPVRSGFGWHVIRLVSSETTPFERVQADIERQLGRDAFDEWLDERFRSVDVDVNPKYGRWNPELGVVSPIRSTADGSPTAVPPSP